MAAAQSKFLWHCKSAPPRQSSSLSFTCAGDFAAPLAALSSGVPFFWHRYSVSRRFRANATSTGLPQSSFGLIVSSRGDPLQRRELLAGGEPLAQAKSTSHQQSLASLPPRSAGPSDYVSGAGIDHLNAPHPVAKWFSTGVGGFTSIVEPKATSTGCFTVSRRSFCLYHHPDGLLRRAAVTMARGMATFRQTALDVAA